MLAMSVKKCEPTNIYRQHSSTKYCGNTLPLTDFKRRKDMIVGELDLAEDRENQCLDCMFKEYEQGMQDCPLEKHLDRIRKRCNGREVARHVPICLTDLNLVENADPDNCVAIILHDKDANTALVPTLVLTKELALDKVVDKWHQQGGTCAICHVQLQFHHTDKETLRSLNDKSYIPPPSNLAVIDRVDTSNDRTAYVDNFQFLCHRCNTVKAGHDIIEKVQLEKEKYSQRAAQLENMIISAVMHKPQTILDTTEKILEQQHDKTIGQAPIENLTLEYYKFGLEQLRIKYHNALQQVARLAFLRQKEKSRLQKYRKWVHDNKEEIGDPDLDQPISISLDMTDFCHVTNFDLENYIDNLTKTKMDVGENNIKNSVKPTISKKRKRKSKILHIEINKK